MATHPNVTLIRKGFKAFSAGDIKTLSDVISSDCVQHMPGKNRFSGDHKGRDSILTMYGELAELTEGTFSVTLDDVYANDHRAVAIYRSTATRGKKKLDERHALAFEIVAGKAIDIEDIPLDGAVNDAFWA